MHRGRPDRRQDGGAVDEGEPLARLETKRPGATGGEGGADVTSRYFAIKVGVPEDPVTGAAHVQLVPFWAARLGRDRLVCRQASPRGGTLWCALREGRVRMAGTAVLYARGEVFLPGG